MLASNRSGGATFDLFEDDTESGARLLDEVDSAGNELSPFLTEDCLTLYFASDRTGDFDLYVATRDSVFVPWNQPARLDALATVAHETDPWLSVDGRHLVFTTSTATSSDVVEATC